VFFALFWVFGGLIKAAAQVEPRYSVEGFAIGMLALVFRMTGGILRQRGGCAYIPALPGLLRHECSGTHGTCLTASHKITFA
jgi:hypothetical protein